MGIKKIFAFATISSTILCVPHLRKSLDSGGQTASRDCLDMLLTYRAMLYCSQEAPQQNQTVNNKLTCVQLRCLGPRSWTENSLGTALPVPESATGPSEQHPEA